MTLTWLDWLSLATDVVTFVGDRRSHGVRGGSGRIKDLGDLEGATRSFSDSIELCRQIGDRTREAQAQNGLGSVYWRQGELVLARTAYERAITGFYDTHQQAGAAVALGNLALVLEDSGRPDEAELRLEESLRILQAKSDQTGMARTLGNLGDLHLLMGNVIAARKNFGDQLEIGKKIGEDKQQAYALQGLGEVYFETGDSSRSEQSFRAALALRTAAHEQDLALETEVSLARVTEAYELAQSAAQEFRKRQQSDEEAQADAVALAGISHRGLGGKPPFLA